MGCPKTKVRGDRRDLCRENAAVTWLTAARPELSRWRRYRRPKSRTTDRRPISPGERASAGRSIPARRPPTPKAAPLRTLPPSRIGSFGRMFRPPRRADARAFSMSGISAETRPPTSVTVRWRRRCACFHRALQPTCGSTKRGGRLQGVSAPGAMHRLAARTTDLPQSRRGLSGPDARPPRDGGRRDGDAQAQAPGRIALRRGEGLARLTPPPPAGAGEGRRPGATDRGRAESETAVGQTRLGHPLPSNGWPCHTPRRSPPFSTGRAVPETGAVSRNAS